MRRWMMAATLMAATLTTAAWAQAPADHNAHHPSDSAKSAPPADAAPSNPPATGAPQGGMGGMGGGMPMMGMMKDMKNDMKSMMDGMSMMNEMRMMQTMRMMDPGAGGMATIDRVEGRIAFLRAELKITDAQGDAWNGFADALRANAKKLGEVRGAMMPNSGMSKSGDAATMADRLDRQEQWLAARLEGTRAIKTAFGKLNESLSDEQRKTANDLLAPHMGMGAMAMMPPQMQRGQKAPGGMQPDQTEPGQTKGSHSH